MWQIRAELRMRLGAFENQFSFLLVAGYAEFASHVELMPGYFFGLSFSPLENIF